MKAFALFGVFVIAKLAILIGHPIQLSGWTLIAYFWQDIFVALIFYLLDSLIKRGWFGWMLYSAAVAYIAINVPIARVLTSPLTLPMIGAAGGALSDSIKHHATFGNLALMLLVIASAIAFPILLGRLRVRQRLAFIIPALFFVLLGPTASSRIETIGLNRNAIMTLTTTALPRLGKYRSDARSDDDWRLSPLTTEFSKDNLSKWSGTAVGRNVVLIVLESAGAKYLRPYGATYDPMPNLSEMAQTSLLFKNAYAVYPESIKAFFSMLCSRYPAMDTETESYRRIRTPSLAAVLKQSGYHTGLFHSGRFMYLGMREVIENRGYDILEDAGAIGGNHESSFGVDEDSTIKRALQWIDSLPPDQHFFLTYLPIAGHHPYDTPAPGPFPEQEESDRYLNALHYADASLGTLLQGLRDRNLDRNTLFVVFGDHGEAFGQHEGNYAHSLFLYEENIHVPYLIAMPGLIRDQIEVIRPISLIDTAPTVLELLGLDSPTEYQGRSALDDQSRMALFYTDYSLSLMGLCDGKWKYIYELDTQRSKLFDLSQDAVELNDLSQLHQERISAYRNILTGWSATQKALILKQTNEQE